MKGLWRRSVVAGMALALDLAGVGLPARWQAGKWGQRAWDLVGRRLSAGQRARLDAPVVMVGAMSGAVAGRALEVWGRRLPEGLDVLTEALLVRSLLSVEALRRAAADLSTALENSDLVAARAVWTASTALADVPCDALTAAQMAAIAISRLTALASRRGIAPLFYYAVGGLPGAMAYHWLAAEVGNHAMGRFGRRLGSLTTAAPAWITASLMTLAAELRGADSLGAERVRQSEGGILRGGFETAPEQAMAGALGITLTSESGRSANASGRAASGADLRRAGSIVGATVGLAGGLLLLGGLVWRVIGRRGEGR